MLHTVPYFPLTKVQSLYGRDVTPSIWKRFPYEDVFEIKIRRARKRITFLYHEPVLYRNWPGINACVRAIAHNEELIKEAQ